MLGLLYHHATLLALILIVTFSAHIFTNAILKNMKKNKKKSRRFCLSVPVIRQLRQDIEKGNFCGFLIKIIEDTTIVDSARARYELKKKPFVITIEAKRHDQ